MTVKERFEALKKKYRYDSEAAEKKIRFIEKHCRHVEGDLYGKPLLLPEVFKDEILRPIFGLKRHNGKRLMREVYIQMPRKNAKTTMMAAVELALLFNDGEPSAQIYNCAGNDEQAALLFNAAKKMAALDATLSKNSNSFQSSIVYKTSYIKKITSKSGTKHGFNSHGVIYDELHVAPNSELYDTLKTSFGQRSNPLMVSITTPGHDKLSLCYNLYEYAVKINSGVIEDDSFWGVIYEANSEADIYSPETWRIANPLYDYSENLRETISDEANMVKNDVSKENTFRRLRLGQWTSSETKWMKTELWTSLIGDVTIEDFRGEPCWLGLDRSSTQDLSSLCVVFESDGFLVPFWYLWISEESAEAAKAFNVRYDLWAKQGHIEIVEGNTVGARGVKHIIEKLAKDYNIVVMGYDEWNTRDLAIELQDELDIETVIERQGYGLSVGLKKIHEVVKNAKVLHNGNPIITWTLDNVLVKENDELRIKIVKPKDYKKIDPWISFAMAVRNWIEVRPRESVYKTRGVISI
jgi:phage terminase large subunit-like protein